MQVNNKKHTNHAYVLKGWKRNANNNNKSSLFEAEAFYKNPEDYKLALHFAMMVDSAHDLLDRKYAIHKNLLFDEEEFKSSKWTDIFGTIARTDFTKTMYALLDIYGYGSDNPGVRDEMKRVIDAYKLMEDRAGQGGSAAPPATTIDAARMRMMGHINDTFLTPAPVNNKNKNVARQRGGYAARMMGRAELQQFLIARMFAVDAGFAPETHRLLGMTLANGSKGGRNVWLTNAIQSKRQNKWSQLTNSAVTKSNEIKIPPQSVNNKNKGDIVVPDEVKQHLNHLQVGGQINMTPISQSTQLLGKITKYVQSGVGARNRNFQTKGRGSFMLYRTKELDVYVTTTIPGRKVNNDSFKVSMNDPMNGNRRIYVIDTGPKFKGPSMDSLMQVATDGDVQDATRRSGFIAACLDIKRDGDMGQMVENTIENEKRMQTNQAPIFLLTGDITAMIIGVMKGASTILVMSEGTYLMYCPLAVEYKTHYVTYRKMVDKSKEILKFYRCPGSGNNLIETFLGSVLNSVGTEGRKSSIYSASRFINKLNNVGPFLASNSQNLSKGWKALNNTTDVTAFKKYFTYALEMPSSALYTAAAELIKDGKNSICTGYIRPNTATPRPNAVKNNTIPNALAVKRNNANKKIQNNKIVGVKTRAMKARNAQTARNARAAENAQRVTLAQQGMMTRARAARNAQNGNTRNRKRARTGEAPPQSQPPPPAGSSMDTTN
jgi:hypothetical protein